MEQNGTTCLQRKISGMFHVAEPENSTRLSLNVCDLRLAGEAGSL